jgi:hypothetical protein
MNTDDNLGTIWVMILQRVDPRFVYSIKYEDYWDLSRLDGEKEPVTWINAPSFFPPSLPFFLILHVWLSPFKYESIMRKSLFAATKLKADKQSPAQLKRTASPCCFELTRHVSRNFYDILYYQFPY